MSVKQPPKKTLHKSLSDLEKKKKIQIIFCNIWIFCCNFYTFVALVDCWMQTRPVAVTCYTTAQEQNVILRCSEGSALSRRHYDEV